MTAQCPVLSDVDDTLTDSRAKHAWAWTRWAQGHGLDPSPFIVVNGLRIEEKLARFAPLLDPETETAKLMDLAARSPHTASALPGAKELFATTPVLALVTSGLRRVVLPQLEAAGLAPLPRVIVAAEDMPVDKTHPEPWQIAADQLGEPHPLVLENAPDAVRGAVAGGFKVVGITTTASPAALRKAGASRVLPDVAAFLAERERGTLGL